MSIHGIETMLNTCVCVGQYVNGDDFEQLLQTNLYESYKNTI